MNEAPRRAGDLPVLVADSDKIGRELGWETQYNSLETIIETAWNWHRRHPHGYQGYEKRVMTEIAARRLRRGLMYHLDLMSS